MASEVSTMCARYSKVQDCHRDSAKECMNCSSVDNKPEGEHDDIRIQSEQWTYVVSGYV